ncbi:S8 family serine peptidase [Pelagibius sp.]|uniref:S8 family serine peptidase n=1 Tax=Pelagibius sp. TaxID=1931238 RepID=UPI003BB140B7
MLLRQDPSGIAPERALVFETLLPIPNFQKAAARIGFELLIEDRLDDAYEIPEELIDDYVEAAAPTLYAVMPSSADLQRMLQLWRAYQNAEEKPYGLAPWWKLFDMLADVRVWGPQDRLTPQAKAELLQELSENDADPIRLELEIWPTANMVQRSKWQNDTRARVEALGGQVLTISSINLDGFSYEAALIDMPSAAVRAMLRNPFSPDGLATIEGLQFVLPQTIAQSLPDLTDDEPTDRFDDLPPFDPDAPISAVILDGTPIAAHPALDGGVVIEDIHDLVRLSQVQHRRHATSMASLILRGDLEADGSPLSGARLLTIPVLVDDANGASSPRDRLFVDMVHIALTRAFLGDEPLAPDAFIVNFSIGVRRSHFAGQISSLARLLDWWADHHGVLFTVSAGNITEDLVIPNMTSIEFENSGQDRQTRLVEEAMRSTRHSRAILAPAEAVNVVTVGAASEDLSDPSMPLQAGMVSLSNDGEIQPAITSGVGLGAFRSIKPDYIHTGGQHDIRVFPAGNHLRLSVPNQNQRTGLHAATAQRGVASRYRVRGTSCSNALATRAHVNSATELLREEGPFAQQMLERRDLALITKALAINAARWPDNAVAYYESEKARLDGNHSAAREEVCRYFGHGHLNEIFMCEAPDYGATMVGTATVRKDRAVLFNVPLPPSLAGERIGRSMWVTIAWFSPVLPTRARYRLALLEAVPHGTDLLGELIEDDGWGLDMKAQQLDANIIKRGTVWSRRLINSSPVVPNYGEEAVLPIRIQCRDNSGGGLSPDDDIHFAVAVTLELETETRFDIRAEIENELRIRLQGRG